MAQYVLVVHMTFCKELCLHGNPLSTAHLHIAIAVGEMDGGGAMLCYAMAKKELFTWMWCVVLHGGGGCSWKETICT